MKTVTINAYMIISILISLLAFYSGILPADTNPKIILWLTAIGSAFGLILKTFFPSGTWAGDGAKWTFYVVNGAVLVSAVATSWGGIGLIAAGTVTAIVGTINILLGSFGYIPGSTTNRA